MTRKDLVRRFAKRMHLTRDEARPYVDTFLEIILDSLACGERIEVRGFGAFQIEDRAERKTRNPRTGDAVMVAPKRIVRFKMGKELRERIRSAGVSANDIKG